ncbi:hypothetical protein ABC383_17615 [Noviherbaspirillum sp. 1P10PC]|uniref:hypothetical protein n=1 Tax=Noviherbaspirillum sp. 1P10PC TaxID=3132292 RepID=UPI00399F02E6
MPYKDPEKQREAARKHAQKKKLANPPWHAAISRERKAVRNKKREIVSQIKRDLGCLLCDESDPNNLQFHHVVPKMKDKTISGLLASRAKMLTILKEIDKCVCVCAACHKNLGERVDIFVASAQREPWFRDWGVEESLEWARLHPQRKLGKKSPTNVINAVIRNSQIQDVDRFNQATKIDEK